MARALGSRYRLDEPPLGSGAMGQVFAGADNDGRRFAFKLLRSDLTGDQDLVARFLQERSILTGLRHPNLVAVHDLVVEGETVAIVMDLVRGGDLRAWLTANGPLLPAEVARIGAGIAAALAQVHAAGVVHRDVKPENVLMDDAGSQRTPRLTDFGISRFANSSEIGRSSLLAGTPRYVAPELANGNEATPAADLYSLGIVLYELCCGVPPFAGPSMLAVIRAHAEQLPGRPEGIPEQLWDLINWLLAKGPQARPHSAQQVSNVLMALTEQLVGAPVATRLDTPPPGTPIAHHQTTQQVAGWPATGQNQGGTVPKRRGRRRLTVALIVVLLLAGGALAVKLATASSTSAAPQPNPTATAVPNTTAAPVPTTDTVTTSAAPPMTTAPNLVGKKLTDAEKILPPSVKVSTVDAVGAADGMITAQDPAAGAALNGTIQLTVARQPVIVYLDTVDPASGQWDRNVNTTALGGKTYLDTVGTEINTCNDNGFAEYNVAKGFRQLSATAGIDDGSASSSLKVQLEIFADGRRVFSNAIQFGTATPVTVDLTGVLRLRFQWELLSGSTECGGGHDLLTLGEAELLGLPGEVPTTSASPTS
jgi:serine/threonine protein kinase